MNNQSPQPDPSPPAEPAGNSLQQEAQNEYLPPLFKAKSTTAAPNSTNVRFPNQQKGRMQKHNSTQQHSFLNALKPMTGGGTNHGHGLVLSDNSEILKVINMNKMQHQYIQNLQKANMTLKCKIKEISELHTEEDYINYQDSQKKMGDETQEKVDPKVSEEEEDLEVIEEAEEMQLHEIGTIEEVSKKAAERKRALSKKRVDRSKSRHKSRHESKGRKHDFYDRNSIGRKEPKYEYREKRSPGKPNFNEKRSPGQKQHRDSDSNYKHRDEEDDDRYYKENRNYDNRRNSNYRGDGGGSKPYYNQYREKNYQDRGHKQQIGVRDNRDSRDNRDYQRHDDDSSYHNQDNVYLDRYQRIKKYGPYDEQARYP